uniref:Uncharacterized protein n=2 Tax=Meloidogyne TaxID=189290 RepID=A0A6V7WZW9_MELEN|nr:unnamed protein product [Meloidogyne enterolobii]
MKCLYLFLFFVLCSLLKISLLVDCCGSGCSAGCCDTCPGLINDLVIRLLMKRK